MAISKESSTKRFAGVVASERGQLYAMTAFNILLAIFLIVGVLRPTISTIVRVRAEISAKETVKTQLTTKIAQISSLRATYNSMQRDIDKLTLIFPQNNDYSLLTINMGELSKRHGFSLNSASYKEAREDPLQLNGLIKIEGSYTLTGDVAQLNLLMDAIEKLPMYPTIDEISYSTASDSGEISVSMKLGFYAFPISEDNL